MTHPSDQKSNEALEKISNLLKKSDQDLLLLTSTQEILKIVTKFVSGFSDQIDYPRLGKVLTLRCIGKKTQESLAAVVRLVEEDQGYYGMALLRPMCEELIFAKFLRTLPTKEADEFLRTKASLEILKGQKAQGDFFTKQQKIFLRDRPKSPISRPTEIRHLSSRIEEREKKLKELGRELGWVKKKSDKPSPSIWYMAKDTDSQDIYNFFFHAASSAVHANSHHLNRMVWGDRETGEYSITNRNFDTYYRKFVLVYGSWLTVMTMSEMQEEFPDSWPEEEEQSYSIWLALLIEPAVRQCSPPIVTERELR